MTKPNDNINSIYDGLSKREYFAAAALQGYCMSQGVNHGDSYLASAAVQAADALIEELNKEKK